MRIIQNNPKFQKTVNTVVPQLGLKNKEGNPIQTLDQLQLSRNESQGEVAYNLDRTLSLVKAQGQSEVYRTRARNRNLAGGAAIAVGLGMIATGDTLTALGGVAVALGSFVPFMLAAEQQHHENDVLRVQREKSYDDGVISRDQYYYGPDSAEQYRSELFDSAKTYARRANALA